jgi:anti-sigma regulatory factor (Ser/Thr protein kinase)
VREATGEDVSTSGTLTLTYATTSIAAARRRLTSELLAAGVTKPAAADAALVASELLTNALRHARPLPGKKLRLGWEVADDAVELAVTDGGAPTRPLQGWPSASSLGGRGLTIVARLSRRWGVNAGEATTTVWAVLGVRAREEAFPSGRDKAPRAVGARAS